MPSDAKLRCDPEPAAIEETGLGALPFDVATDWSVEAVDRIGEWYTYVLLYPAPGDEVARLKNAPSRLVH